ncbi:UdgX family uracil-DNA binding protein [Streptomyces sp. NPDC095613]|uniref:UdgX family uracil-DNA binding protein n=1 Tax=Streptomyces sp. NPDC095613 TaxID=3155540 RepID=UPI00331C0FD2
MTRQRQDRDTDTDTDTGKDTGKDTDTDTDTGKGGSVGTGPGQAYDAAPYLPDRGGLAALRRAAADCHGCPLYENATRTVFGSGPASARVVLVGEQPGDQEDRQGEPFVGPAGHMLRKALEEAGLDVAEAYLTNAVKHFKFTSAGPGKRRIHKAPSLREMTACRPWLTAELHAVGPEVVVALGATAGKALFGPSFRVTKDRGALIPLPPPGPGGRGSGAGGSPAGGPTADGSPAGREDTVYGLATIHPSAVLRADDRAAVYAGLVGDLRVAADALRTGPGSRRSR